MGRIIGPNGEHMKTIHAATGAKLRLRGKRSMVCVKWEKSGSECR